MKCDEQADCVIAGPVIDPTQEWLDSLPPEHRVKRHVEKIRMLRARVAVMEAEGVAAKREGIFVLYKSDALKQIAILEGEVRAELARYTERRAERLRRAA